MTKVANSTKCVMPSMALVSPSLRLIAATISVIATITVCTGDIAMMKGWPV
ncbi:hypothetical protein D3C71_2192560 [compost metagenome]